jgi:hypothetical protein
MDWKAPLEVRGKPRGTIGQIVSWGIYEVMTWLCRVI